MPSDWAKNAPTLPVTVTFSRRLLMVSWSGVTVTPLTPSVKPFLVASSRAVAYAWAGSPGR